MYEYESWDVMTNDAIYIHMKYINKNDICDDTGRLT